MLQFSCSARALALILPLAAAGCGTAPPPEPPVPAVPVFDPNVDVTPGFNEREPDTCKASGLQYLLGQPSTVFDTMTLPGPLRVIAPHEVYDQEEYRSNRIDVRIDAAGAITSIGCG